MHNGISTCIYLGVEYWEDLPEDVLECYESLKFGFRSLDQLKCQVKPRDPFNVTPMMIMLVHWHQSNPPYPMTVSSGI